MKKIIAVSAAVLAGLVVFVTVVAYFLFKGHALSFPKGNFVFDENGYAFSTLPYGCTPEDFAAVLDTETKTSAPRSQPFPHEIYTTTQEIWLLSAYGTASAQFADDGLSAFTFTTQLPARKCEALRKELLELYAPDFGEPVSESSVGTGQVSMLWEDSETGTALEFKVSAVADNRCTLRIRAFEKWRYVEAGVGEWAGEG